MIENKFKGLRTLIFGVLMLMFSLAFVSVAQANEVGYTIKLMDNPFQKAGQRDVGYFDLIVPPNQSADLQIVLINTSDKQSTFSINVTNATTTSNLGVDYTPTTVRSKTLKIGITDLLKAEQTSISLEPKASQTISFHLTTPNEAIAGTVLGGIHVIKDLTESEKKQGFVSQSAYVKPVKIVSSDPPAITTPKFEFDSCQIKTVNYAKRVVATVSNTEPVYLSELKMISKITRKGKSNVLLSRTVENGSLAPSSTFDLLFDFDGTVLTAGKYTYKITFFSSDKEWSIEKDFEIEGIDTSFVLSGLPNRHSNAWLYWLIILIIILALILFIFLLWRKRNRKKQPVAKKQKNKKTYKKRNVMIMKTNRKLIITTTALLASLALAPATTFAVDDNSPSTLNGSVKVDLNDNGQTTNGAVTLQTVTDFNVAIDRDAGTSSPHTLSATGDITVIDTRSAGTGWELKLTASQPKHASTSENLGATAITITTTSNAAGIVVYNAVDTLSSGANILKSTARQSYTLPVAQISGTLALTDFSGKTAGTYLGTAVYTLTPSVA